MLARMFSISWPHDPPALASQSAGITGISHLTQPENVCILSISLKGTFAAHSMLYWLFIFLSTLELCFHSLWLSLLLCWINSLSNNTLHDNLSFLSGWFLNCFFVFGGFTVMGLAQGVGYSHTCIYTRPERETNWHSWIYDLVSLPENCQPIFCQIMPLPCSASLLLGFRLDIY